MSVQILKDKATGYQCLYCTTTMTVFGEVYCGEEDLNNFLKWLPKDARQYTREELSDKFHEWMAENGTINKR